MTEPISFPLLSSSFLFRNIHLFTDGLLEIEKEKVFFVAGWPHKDLNPQLSVSLLPNNRVALMTLLRRRSDSFKTLTLLSLI